MKNINLSFGLFAPLTRWSLVVLLLSGLSLNAQDKAAKSEAKAIAPDPKEDERFEARSREIQQAAMKALHAEYEKGAQQLLKEFPNRSETYELLMEVASKAEAEKARRMAQQIIDSSAAGDDVKDAAKALVKKMDAVGKPVDFKFTAVDGREVDLAKMKGKVVLVDFWATWCGPCVKELPNVKAAYDSLHSKGFEIIGISFDQKKDQLEKFTADKKMEWPQFFDGKGWANKFGKEFGINSIPAMWLIDKKGNLRDVEAREGLAEKVEKLLAEK